MLSGGVILRVQLKLDLGEFEQPFVSFDLVYLYCFGNSLVGNF